MPEYMIYEILGYVASLVILLSMAMSSIVKLRITNMIGAALFSIYGLCIGSIPVAGVNGVIAFINLGYLISYWTKKEYFKALPVRGNNKYLLEFLKFYKDDIEKYFPGFSYDPEQTRYSFFILRNMNVAGIFIAKEYTPGTLLITLDYATPQYRDFKVGKYIYSEYFKKFLIDGYTKLIIYSQHRRHQRYLIKMGFKRQRDKDKTYFVKNLIEVES